ncbi:hypothetical protein FD755_014525 [Muntiacus reevesi]|uniref:Protein kinase domain-containing protein n=1 Tax=Muntiacus reevesi TaxID=9886 RepID=A0A5N3XJG4_MUNRE|nr:hypothetical protein FD755_014525 [Muntiacus reevesi]
MGNQLAGIAPSQILSVESYFSDIHDFEYDKSLGSTRFFKVARAKHREGLVVVKVFAIQDPTLPLTSYKQELEELKIRLHSAQNCLPFQKAAEKASEKAAMLFRQYVRDNLYDRISTRPFLNNIEKRWIAFQILTAVDQAHKSGVRHGDIKTENVMVTSWNWVLLTDFASFKPTYLPEDNPADFNYFFDTSRRRTCYIAPERFVDGGLFATELEYMRDPSTPLVDLNSNQRTRGELKRAMDIFSAGVRGYPGEDVRQAVGYKGWYPGEYHMNSVPFFVSFAKVGFNFFLTLCIFCLWSHVWVEPFLLEIFHSFTRQVSKCLLRVLCMYVTVIHLLLMFFPVALLLPNCHHPSPPLHPSTAPFPNTKSESGVDTGALLLTRPRSSSVFISFYQQYVCEFKLTSFFFSRMPSLWSSSHILIWLLEKP